MCTPTPGQTPPAGVPVCPRAPLLILALLGACGVLPPLSGGHGTPAPTPEVVKLHPWMADVRWPGAAPRPPPQEELLIAEDIDLLLTGDFDVYPLAGRRLIARGEDVLPYLGHAADRHPSPTARKERLTVAFGPVLRDTTEARVLLALSSPYPAVRAAAAAAAGEREAVPLAPRLIELLDDKDVRVRRAAIASLRRITGEFIGYDPEGAPAARAAGAEKWDQYWKNR
ncbi:MAG TPA: HEAT repeat domain-containing protein [Planctomycetota bacterium]|nr:HEAT repeat domain-containing protein [Planctomycetota bacterium]